MSSSWSRQYSKAQEFGIIFELHLVAHISQSQEIFKNTKIMFLVVLFTTHLLTYQLFFFPPASTFFEGFHNSKLWNFIALVHACVAQKYFPFFLNLLVYILKKESTENLICELSYRPKISITTFMRHPVLSLVQRNHLITKWKFATKYWRA